MVCLARVGAEDQRIVTSTVEAARSIDMGAPLHSLVGHLHLNLHLHLYLHPHLHLHLQVIPGNCHYLEQEALAMWKL